MSCCCPAHCVRVQLVGWLPSASRPPPPLESTSHFTLDLLPCFLPCAPQVVADYNADPNVHGILVQLPLPKHINEQRVLDAISIEKASWENTGLRRAGGASLPQLQ